MVNQVLFHRKNRPTADFTVDFFGNNLFSHEFREHLRRTACPKGVAQCGVNANVIGFFVKSAYTCPDLLSKSCRCRGFAAREALRSLFPIKFIICKLVITNKELCRYYE